MSSSLRISLVCLLAAGSLSAAFGQENRPMSQPALQDSRFHAPRTLDDPVPPPRFDSREAWEKRRQALRMQVLVSTGLWPARDRTPLKAHVFGRVERDGYTIEKVYFESLPGFYVTGNLYRPLGAKGRVPGVLATHGHWAQGRMANEDLGSIPGRCISLARQGMVAFSYDMIGYNDSLQLPHNPEHGTRIAGAPPEFWEPRKALWGLSLMGLQTWNSIRALDFLETLPDVDPKRLAITGESGGGTQTFMLTAVDDRPAVSCPVNMISLHMQGGCLCENAPGLRVGTNNVEIGALMAPRPMLMVAATGDWTVNTPKLEYPATRAIYELLGAGEKVDSVQIDAPHNYNKASREAMYTFFRRWLLGIADGRKVEETPFQMDPVQDLRVFPDGRLPAGAKDAAVIAGEYLHDAADRAAHLVSPERMARRSHREALRAAFAACLKAEVPAPGTVEAREQEAQFPGGEDYRVTRLVLSRRGVGDAVPALLFRPARARNRVPVVLALAEGGKGDLLEEGRPGPLIRALLSRGRAVLAPDLFLTGESAEAAHAQGITRDHQAAFFTTYNVTDTGERVQDILTAIAYLRDQPGYSTVSLVAMGRAGLWALLARGLAPRLGRSALDAAGFDSEDDAAYLAGLFVPSLRQVGDFATAAALAGASPLLLHNTGGRFDARRVGAAHRAAGARAEFRAETDRLSADEVAEWIAGRTRG